MITSVYVPGPVAPNILVKSIDHGYTQEHGQAKGHGDDIRSCSKLPICDADPTSTQHRIPIWCFLGNIYIQDCWARILVQFTRYRRLLIGRDGNLDQSEAYDLS